jgi:hypothetical protein
MKVRALASISGPDGRRAIGDEFEVDSEVGADLIGRRLADAVEAEPAPKPAKALKAQSSVEQ